MVLQSFIYTTGWITLAVVAGNAVEFVLTIGADADFKCNYVTCHVRQANLLVANWAGDIVLNDSGKGRTLSNQAIAVDAIAGNGQLPYPFNPPRIFPANSSMVLTITNNVATATQLQVCFHGNKMYKNEESLYTGEVQV